MSSLVFILNFINGVIKNMDATYSSPDNVSYSSQTLLTGETEHELVKKACMIFAAIAVPIVTLLLYSIIWYEHFGSDNKRTLQVFIFLTQKRF